MNNPAQTKTTERMSYSEKDAERARARSVRMRGYLTERSVDMPWAVARGDCYIAYCMNVYEAEAIADAMNAADPSPRCVTWPRYVAGAAPDADKFVSYVGRLWITELTQRWTDGRDSYRPAGEPIRTSDYEVARIDTDRVAKNFVIDHHYSGTYPAARFRFGLHRRDELVGVAVFSVPANYAALACLPGDPKASVELGRFVLLDDVPANGESWFLARCFERLRELDVVGVVSFSDPTPRTSSHGARVFGGHIGTIYQATNARYLGTSKAETRRLLPDGSLIHGRALTKIRNRRRGWRYAAELLVRHGATELAENEDARAWVSHWTDKLCRPLPHPGNHKYAWTLSRRDRRHLPAGMTYPKIAA